MKRVHKSAEEPELLRAYRERHPQDTWERFRRKCRGGYKEVKAAIIRDQRGLCAYCEIAVKEAEEYWQVDDFRVEHFYPKSAGGASGRNYHLDWNNLLGVCHGGSQPYVPEAEIRYAEDRNNRSCDVPKGARQITRRILNPLELPDGVRLFRYAEHSGKMIIDEKACPKELRAKAVNTIRELNLNAPRLMRMRVEVMRALEDEISLRLERGLEIGEIASQLAESLLLPDTDGMSLPFFSVMRWYLGEAAEAVIKASGGKI